MTALTPNTPYGVATTVLLTAGKYKGAFVKVLRTTAKRVYFNVAGKVSFTALENAVVTFP